MAGLSEVGRCELVMMKNAGMERQAASIILLLPLLPCPRSEAGKRDACRQEALGGQVVGRELVNRWHA